MCVCVCVCVCVCGVYIYITDSVHCTSLRLKCVYICVYVSVQFHFRREASRMICLSDHLFSSGMDFLIVTFSVNIDTSQRINPNKSTGSWTNTVNDSLKCRFVTLDTLLEGKKSKEKARNLVSEHFNVINRMCRTVLTLCVRDVAEMYIDVSMLSY